MHGIPINEMEELLAVESSEEGVGGRLGGGITVPIVGMGPKWS